MPTAEIAHTTFIITINGGLVLENNYVCFVVSVAVNHVLTVAMRLDIYSLFTSIL